MEYKLNEVRAGEFEVVRSMPVVIGTFADQEIARKFMLFLMEEELDAQQDLEDVAANADEQPAAPVIAPEVAPATSVTPVESQPKMHRAPYTPATKNAEKADMPVEISDEPWTEVELASAFKMLSEGSALKTVAARHGKCWKKLRSKWAFRKKTQSQQDAEPASGALVPMSESTKTPLEKVTAAVVELAAQDECRICKRHFTPTLDNLDLCARCSHGA